MNLRIPFLLPLLLALLPANLRAEDMAAPDLGQDGPTGTLSGDQGTFDPKTSSAHVSGNVHLIQPGVLDLRCEDFIFRQSTNAAGKGKIDQIIATTNVVMLMIQAPPANRTGTAPLPTTNRAVAFRAVFDGTENTVKLTGSPETGSPRYETQGGVVTAPILTYDRVTGRFKGEQGFLLTFKANLLKDSSFFSPRTNSPATK